MTEQEWQACEDPDALLAYAGDQLAAETLRMFAVLCCRRILPVLSDELRQSLDVAERLARDDATDQQRKSARRVAMTADQTGSELRADLLDRAHGQAKQAVALALRRKPRDAARYAKNLAVWAAVCLRWQDEPVPFPTSTEGEEWKRYQELHAEERRAQCDMFRELVDYADLAERRGVE